MLKLCFYTFFCITICSGKETSKIVGGSGPVPIFVCPFTASLQYQGHHMCSANIISHYHLITTASCVLFDRNVIAGNLKILTGTNDRFNDFYDGDYHNVQLVIYHSDYQPQLFWKNDISILKLELPIGFSMYRDAIYLPTYAFSTRGKVYTYGWGEGFFLINSGPSKFLHKLWMKIESKVMCDMHFRNWPPFHGYQGCAVSLSLDSGITNGNGGNGLIRRVGTLNLQGIISVHSVVNINSVVYTKVYFYNVFIHEIVSNY